ncbi:MAG TPA: hypothetical protein VFB99_15685, partial [Vicinamibacterales bacterium]|nr:hypothetical protein [Vicinamibacterales bacterium]
KVLAQLTEAVSEAFDIDPYFLDSGELSDVEQNDVIQLETYRERQMVGQPTVIPRGFQPRRAPTYRFVYWTGDIGDPSGRFASPLAVEAMTGRADAYRINGQILGFRCASDDWGSRADRGTLTVELRTRVGTEPMTWLFVQQFDTDSQGFTNIGYEYVAQRDGAPNPAFTDDQNVGLRFQLMRAPSRSGQVFRKVLSAALVLSGVPMQLENRNLQSALKYLPPLRVPALLQEGAALTQAVIGGTADEAPIWRGGFSSYGLSSAGSQLSLAPGFWMAIDAEREIDLRGVVLDDIGGTIAPQRDGELLDCNYLVVGLDINEGPRPDYLGRA